MARIISLILVCAACSLVLGCVSTDQVVEHGQVVYASQTRIGFWSSSVTTEYNQIPRFDACVMDLGDLHSGYRISSTAGQGIDKMTADICRNKIRVQVDTENYRLQCMSGMCWYSLYPGYNVYAGPQRGRI